MKNIIILGASILLIVASLLTGCTEQELSQQELEQIIQDVLSANNAVTTCKFDMDMMADIEIVGGPNASKAPLTASGTGVVDTANKKVHMTMDMTIGIPGKGKQEISATYYFIEDLMYTKMSLPDKGDHWFKLELPADMWDQKSQLNQQMEIFRTAEQVKYLGTEDINGVSCYIVQITPGREALRNMMSQMDMQQMAGVDLKNLDLANLFKDLTIKEWIARDSYMLMKTEQNMILEIKAEDLGATEDDFEKIVENITVNVLFYDYNDPVSIDLPAEALQAQGLK